MSAKQRSAGSSQISRQELTRSAYVFIITFLGALTAGILAALAFSASGCFVSRAIRCFSISRDALGLLWFVVKGWSLPAFVAALLAAMVVQVRSSISWRSALIVALVSSMLANGVLLYVGNVANSEFILVFCVSSLLLFVGLQLSRLMDNLFGGYST